MQNQGLKTLAFVLPVTFIGLILLILLILWGVYDSLGINSLALTFVIIAVGIVTFTFLVFSVNERRESEIRQRSRQLAGLHEAALALTRELEVAPVLQSVVDQARDLVGARYGALGVLAEDGRYIAQFKTSGLSPERRANMGELPQGHGLLGELITSGHPLRVPKIGADPSSAGFPPNHPPMTTLLGMPIRYQEEIVGDLYLTDKLGSSQEPVLFSDADEQILEMFATQAAIAIKNAQLHRESRELVLLKERERFGMDLHDGVIQSIYAIGLLLEDTQFRVDQDPTQVKALLGEAMQGLDGAIRNIRGYILDLQPDRIQGLDLAQGLDELVRELKAHSFIQVKRQIEEQAAARLSSEQVNSVLHIAREALVNIRKHARAGQAEIRFGLRQEQLELIIRDDGSGFEVEALARKGQGLRNMHERAESLGGVLTIERLATAGTQILLII